VTTVINPDDIRSQIREIADDPDLDDDSQGDGAAATIGTHNHRNARGGTVRTAGTRGTFAKRQGAAEHSENTREPLNIHWTTGSHQT